MSHDILSASVARPRVRAMSFVILSLFYVCFSTLRVLFCSCLVQHALTVLLFIDTLAVLEPRALQAVGACSYCIDNSPRFTVCCTDRTAEQSPSQGAGRHHLRCIYSDCASHFARALFPHSFLLARFAS
jgi:hypothetical protein